MDNQTLIHELERLNAEVARLERRIAAGEGGLVEHILLQATIRTQATTRQALLEAGARPSLLSRPRISARPSLGTEVDAEAQTLARFYAPPAGLLSARPAPKRPRTSLNPYAATELRFLGLYD